MKGVVDAADVLRSGQAAGECQCVSVRHGRKARGERLDEQPTVRGDALSCSAGR